MILQSCCSSSWSFDFSPRFYVSRRLFCPCADQDHGSVAFCGRYRRRRRRPVLRRKFGALVASSNLKFISCGIRGDSENTVLANSTSRATKNLVIARFSNDFQGQEFPQESSVEDNSNNFTNFREDPLVDKLRTQLGVIHPIPSPPINRDAVGLFALFFVIGVVFDKLWTSRKRWKQMARGEGPRGIGPWPQVPTSFSLFLEKDLQRKESVEWVNMVLGKLWKVYRGGIENWIIGLLQPIIDDLQKPDYVQRVEIKQFSLGDEALSVRNVERRTSRCANDLQYQIGLRYTGGARMLLMLSLKFGIIPITVPVGVRNFDIDGELWVKLRLIPTEPWVGAASWAFVSLPKIKFELSAFQLFNLMAIPVLSMFLTKLLTEDLPRLFVRPKKIVLDFQKGRAVGPIAQDVRSEEIPEGNKDFVGELSVTLIDAQKVPYVFYGKTDPYVILRLGDQIICSKKNSQTTVFGPPGQPIWNQDFHFLVSNPREQKLQIDVNDCLGFADLAIGAGEVDLGSLQDTVPTDRIVPLRGGWSWFGRRPAGEILLRLTYKAYVEDEEDDTSRAKRIDSYASDDELSDSEELGSVMQNDKVFSDETAQESFMNVLSALILSEEFQGIVSSEAGNSKLSDDGTSAVSLSSRSVSVDPRNSSEGNAGVSASNSVGANSDKGFDGDGGLALLWFGVITGLLVLVAINMSGSSFFNP